MAPRPAGPARRVLWALVLLALAVHGVLLLGLAAPLQLRLSSPPAGPSVRVRLVPAAPLPVAPRLARAPVRASAPSPLAASAPARPLEADTSATAWPAAPGAEEASPGPAQEPAGAPLLAAEAPLAASVAAEAVAPPERVESSAWPLISLGALPASRVITYRLTGMDKGLTYHASGELRWQHNDTAYELALSVRAFLLGSRHWRSVGRIDALGLSPRRFSDSWRSERAAHFDHEQQRIVFSSNSTPVPLQAGAQDQVSLYVQLAAAMGGEPERFGPGTRLEVQTATVRDALPWSLVQEGEEPLTLEDGTRLHATRWVCQPRNRFDARVEFWVTAAQDWLPVRIRITQASGSYIDLHWRGTEALPVLPLTEDAGPRVKSP